MCPAALLLPKPVLVCNYCLEQVSEGLPVPDVVGQLVELPHAPVGQARPAAGPNAAGVVVELLGIPHEEVDEQEQHDKGGYQQVAYGHAPAHAASGEAKSTRWHCCACHVGTFQNRAV